MAPLTRFQEAFLQSEYCNTLNRIDQSDALSVGMKKSLTLDIAQEADLLFCDEINGDALPPKAAAATNPMHIHFLVLWKVVVYDNGNLLNIDAAGQHVSGDQNS